MATYINIEGVKGEVTLPTYKNWIRISELRWHFTSLNSGSLADSGLGTSRQKFNTFVVRQQADASMTDILKLMQPDKTIASIKGAYTDTDDDKSLVYANYTWKNCQIHQISQSKHYSDNPLIEYAITYTSCEVKTTAYTADGKAQSPKIATYDVEKGIWS